MNTSRRRWPRRTARDKHVIARLVPVLRDFARGADVPLICRMSRAAVRECYRVMANFSRGAQALPLPLVSVVPLHRSSRCTPRPARDARRLGDERHLHEIFLTTADERVRHVGNDRFCRGTAPCRSRNAAHIGKPPHLLRVCPNRNYRADLVSPRLPAVKPISRGDGGCASRHSGAAVARVGRRASSRPPP